MLKTTSGISKVYFAELPKEVQERFGYGLVQNLEQRCIALQNQEYEILQQIGKAEEAKKHLPHVRGKELSEMELLAAQLPALHSELDNVRAAKEDAKRQLQKAQQGQRAQPPNDVQALHCARHFD